MRTGPILIIEDDREDQELLQEIFLKLDYPNQILFFTNGNDALEYLDKASTPPVLIISDINMPKIDGFEVKRKINKNKELQDSNIPFIFFTTSAATRSITDAYSLSDQGFFVKPHSMENLRSTVKTIVDYWLRCYTPGVPPKASERKISMEPSHPIFNYSITRSAE